MSAKRKQKLREREARLRKLRQRGISAAMVSGKEINIQREVDHIVGCAADHDTRCVSLGAFMFFSTGSGDAWMLDTDDRLALCLARSGEAVPVRIMETDSSAAVEWEYTYALDEDRFIVANKNTGRVTTVVGYPTQAILAAIQRGKEAQR